MSVVEPVPQLTRGSIGGGRRIRTPGIRRPNGFQDQFVDACLRSPDQPFPWSSDSTSDSERPSVTPNHLLRPSPVVHQWYGNGTGARAAFPERAWQAPAALPRLGRRSGHGWCRPRAAGDGRSRSRCGRPRWRGTRLRVVVPLAVGDLTSDRRVEVRPWFRRLYSRDGAVTRTVASAA